MSKPGLINDDCFAEFDAAFAALDKGIHEVPALPARVTPSMPVPVSAGAAEPIPPPSTELALGLDEYEDAFEKLDAVLAGVERPEPSPIAQAPPPVLPLPAATPNPAPVYTATVPIPAVAASDCRG